MSELHRKKLKKDEADLPNLTPRPINLMTINLLAIIAVILMVVLAFLLASHIRKWQ